MKNKHLHPAAILYFWYKAVKDWLLLILIPAIRDFDFFIDKILIFVVLFLVLTLLLAVTKYFMYTYELTNTEIILNTGIIFRKHTHIAYAKIQTLETQQWFYLRPFGLMSLKIETSGHSDSQAEGIMPVVSKQIIAHLQKLRNSTKKFEHETVVFKPATDNTQEQSASKEDPEEKYQLKWSDLNLYALTSFGVLPLFLLFLSVYDKITDIIPEKRINSIFNEIMQQGIVVITLGIIFSVLLALLVSYLLLINRYFNFSVQTQNNRLVTSRGLLQKNEVSVPKDRVQAVVIHQSLLRQLFKLATVQLMLASGVPEDDEQDDELVMMPVIRTNKALQNSRKFISWLPQKMQRQYLIQASGKWRLIRNIFIPTLLLVIFLCVIWRPVGFISIVLLPLSFWIGHYAGDNSGITIEPNKVLALQKGELLSRKLYLIPHKRIQSVRARQSIWMKRVNLSHLEISLRSGNSSQIVEVRYLPTQTVKKVYQWFRSETNIDSS